MRHRGGTAWQYLKLDLRHKLDATLRWICLAGLEQQTCDAGFMQSCINIACQGQDYVNIVNADATLRQDVNVAWISDCINPGELKRQYIYKFWASKMSKKKMSQTWGGGPIGGFKDFTRPGPNPSNIDILTQCCISIDYVDVILSLKCNIDARLHKSCIASLLL